MVCSFLAHELRLHLNIVKTFLCVRFARSLFHLKYHIATAFYCEAGFEIKFVGRKADVRIGIDSGIALQCDLFRIAYQPASRRRHRAFEQQSVCRLKRQGGTGLHTQPLVDVDGISAVESQIDATDGRKQFVEIES